MATLLAEPHEAVQRLAEVLGLGVGSAQQAAEAGHRRRRFRRPSDSRLEWALSW
jgi:hypothetical protein